MSHLITGRWCVARVGLSLTTGTEQERLARSTSKSIHYCLCIYNMYVAASIWWSGLYYAMQGVPWYAVSSLLFSKCTGFCMKACEPYIPWMHDKKHTQYYVALLQALNPSFSSMYCVCVCVCNIEKVGVPTYYTRLSAEYTLWLYCHYRAPCVHVSIQKLHSHNTFSLV